MSWRLGTDAFIGTNMGIWGTISYRMSQIGRGMPSTFTPRLIVVGQGVALASAFLAGYAVGDIFVVIDEKYNNGSAIDKISRIIFYPLEYKDARRFENRYGSRK